MKATPEIPELKEGRDRQKLVEELQEKISSVQYAGVALSAEEKRQLDLKVGRKLEA